MSARHPVKSMPQPYSSSYQPARDAQAQVHMSMMTVSNQHLDNALALVQPTEVVLPSPRTNTHPTNASITREEPYLCSELFRRHQNEHRRTHSAAHTTAHSSTLPLETRQQRKRVCVRLPGPCLSENRRAPALHNMLECKCLDPVRPYSHTERRECVCTRVHQHEKTNNAKAHLFASGICMHPPEIRC